jgi:hypothetical protein
MGPKVAARVLNSAPPLAIWVELDKINARVYIRRTFRVLFLQERIISRLMDFHI